MITNPHRSYGTRGNRMPRRYRFRCQPIVFLIGLVGIGLLAGPAHGQSWQSVQVTCEYPNPDKPNQPAEKRTITLKIPGGMAQGEAIRGVMPDLGGLQQFAHRNRIALYSHRTPGPLGMPPQAMLDAAAAAAKRPELKYAGAILQGLSSKGRERAHAAAFEPDRVIAVLLDHSWTPPGPTGKPTKFEYGHLPEAAGVPYFFNASRNDSFQGFDRRALHYNWCTSAFRTKNQPCTSVIHHERGGHGNCGSRDLQAVWLEEMLPLRVPEKIPTDGTPYKLIPVNPQRTGGLVIATLGKDEEGLSIHTEVSVGPVSVFSQRGQCNWWVPGPKTAQMYLDWVKRNGGTIHKDMTHRFAAADGATDAGDGHYPAFNPPSERPAIAAIQQAISSGRVGLGLARLDAIVKKNADAEEVADAQAIRKKVEQWLAAQRQTIEQVMKVGDAYAAAETLAPLIQAMAGSTQGRELAKQMAEIRRSDDYRAGRRYHQLERTVQRLTPESRKIQWANFAKQYPDSYYGKMAQKLAESQ